MLGGIRFLVSTLGPSWALKYAISSRLRRGEAVRVPLPPWLGDGPAGSDRALLRTGTSDVHVYRQIFVEREYAPLEQLSSVSTILDLGANVGYSSRYFLGMFPTAKLLAIEPDPDNFAMLERQLSMFSDRATVVRGGVWDSCGTLCLASDRYRDGAEWSRQVKRAATGEVAGVFRGFDIPSLMSMAGFERVSLLKIDIEGAEAVVFNAPNLSWLDRVDNIAIELHDDSQFGMASPVFWRAVQDRGFSFSKSGELVIGMRE
jgi:FkbM family methyltransferase